MNVNPWAEFLTRLQARGVIAEWRLDDGVAFFMTFPERGAVDDAGIVGRSVRFSELASVVVRAIQPLGGLTKANDLAALRAALPALGLHVADEGETITLSSIRQLRASTGR